MGTYDETKEKATSFAIMLKARARNSKFQTPFQANAKTLTRIEYIHNIIDNGITLIIEYDSDARIFTYVCRDIDCIDMVACLSKSMSKDFTEAKEEERMKKESLIF